VKLQIISLVFTSQIVTDPSLAPEKRVVPCKNLTHLKPGVFDPGRFNVAIGICVATSWMIKSPTLDALATKLSKLFQESALIEL